MECSNMADSFVSTDVLILGGGPAGIQAANLLRRHNNDLRVTLVRPEQHSMIYCAIPYALEGLFPLTTTYKKDAMLTDCGARLIRGTAAAVDFADRRITLASGGAVAYSKLLIATGAEPVYPPVPGAGLANIFTVKTQEDAQRIISVLTGGNCRDHELVKCGPDGPKKVVVVGAGAIGMEQAAAYRVQGMEVHLVEMQGWVLPQMLDEDMAQPVHDALREAGIHLHVGVSVEGFEGVDAVATVRLSDGSRIELDAGRDFVVMAVGMRPCVDVFQGSDLQLGRDGVVVDAQMRTSIPGVWAAGDCCQFVSGIDGQPIGGKLATNAVPMAKVAALDILRKQARYPGFFNGAATVVGRLRVGGTGFTEQVAVQRGCEVYSTYGDTTSRFPMMPGATAVRVKLVVEAGTRRLLGGQVWGSEAVAERVDLLTLALQQKMTVDQLAEFSYSAQPWQTFFPARNAIVEAAQKAVGLL